MSIDPRYVTSVDLNPYLVDKDTGAPLAGGVIEFYQDDNRNVGKLVYELTGAPPNYTYTALPNPVVLSATGTITDSSGANIALYYYPYDSQNTDASVQLYYVVVKNSLGVIQFTREAWPNISEENAPGAQSNNTNINQLSNPQFSEILFDPEATLNINFSGSTTDTYAVAPDWNLIVGHTGNGSITISRTYVVGSSAYPTNPPYTLTISPGANVSFVQLVQRLYKNTDIWSADNTDSNGYVGTSILLGPNNQNVTVTYRTSDNQSQLLLSANNDSGLYQQFSNTVQLNVASNPYSSQNGYVDIIVSVPAVGATTFSSIQVVGLENDIPDIKFNQLTVYRQIDQLFHYYQPQINAKPINSYLVGWDFPVNPAQFGSTVSIKSTGNNTSNYIWDQTICFQSSDASVSFARSNVGTLVATAAADTQIALIQYLEPPLIKEILNNRLSVNLSAFTSQSDGISGTVTLWYCTDANLPDMGVNASIVSQLDANGVPFLQNGTWSKITRTFLPDATFTIPQNPISGSSLFTDVGLSGWDMGSNITAIASATYFAIVVGFETLTSAHTISFNSISLVPGEIPTRPAPLSFDETLRKCERYYEKSYNNGVAAGTITNEGCILAPMSSTVPGGPSSTISAVNPGFCVNFKSVKWKSISNMTFYSPNSGSSDNLFSSSIYGSQTQTSELAITYFLKFSIGNKSVVYTPTQASSGTVPPTWTPSATTAGLPAASWMIFHYIADTRLGIV